MARAIRAIHTVRAIRAIRRSTQHRAIRGPGADSASPVDSPPPRPFSTGPYHQANKSPPTPSRHNHIP